MSSRRGGRPFFAANNDDFSSKGKGVSQFDPKTEQLTQGIAYVNLGLGQDDGRWETFSKKTKNRGGGSGAAVQWGPTAHGSNPRAWVNTDMAPKPGMRNYSGSGRAAGNPRQTPNAGYMRRLLNRLMIRKDSGTVQLVKVVLVLLIGTVDCSP